MNPYRHMQVKVRALLASEAKLSAEERRQNQWMLQVSFCGTKLLVGKGDVNTIFYQLGDGKRNVVYPDTMLERLEAWAAQPFYLYVAMTKDGKRQTFTTLERLKAKVEVRLGMKILGLRDDQQTVVAVSRNGLDSVEWKQVRGK